MWSVVATEFLKVRVPQDVKHRVAVTVERKFLTESAWLRGLIMRELAAAEGISALAETTLVAAALDSCQGQSARKAGSCSCRVHIRLRPDDWLLLNARAEARGMRPATYVSVLTRSHLRRLAPLPRDELLALRRSIGELAALGRNINQIAKASNTGGRLPGSMSGELRAMLSICEALRDHTKALLMANLASWTSGFEVK
jgi:hypothetical protein